MNKILVISIIGLLVLGSVLTAGIYFLTAPDDEKDKDIMDDDSEDDGGSLSLEVQKKWQEYSDQVDSPEIITTDPGIAKAAPGESLEKLAQLEGMSNFTDSHDGTSEANDSGQALGGGDGDYSAEPPSAEESEDAKTADDGGTEREVEEADLVKVIDDTMFILNSYRGLITVDISEPEDAYIQGQCSVIGYPKEMYVVDFLALITVRTDYNYWYRYWEMDAGITKDESVETGTIGTMIYIVNVADPSDPKILKIVELEGFPAESRRVGHVIYQATNSYSWYYYDGADDETIVSSINFGDPETVGMTDQIRFSGSSNQVHASPTAFYVAQPIYDWYKEWEAWDDYEYYTKVTYLDISDPDGEIEKRDTFKVPGFLEDKYQMDEYKKMFRMVTHFWNGLGESKLYIFDISNPDDIDQMGSLLVDDAGTLTATRFAGERAYTIHLPRSIDPLDVLDLSNPYKPKLCDVFEMPGWVTHMEVYGMKIIALGVDDSEGERNVAVSLFDVSDPYNVDMEDRVRLGGEYAYSEANWEPKALTIDDDHNIVLVPYSSYDRDYKNIYGVQIVSFDLNDGDLELQGTATSDYSIERTRVVDDYVLATSFKTLQIVDISSLDEPEVVKVIELAVNVNDIVPLGDHYIQMVSDWYTDNVVIRSVDDPDDLEAVDTESIDSYWGKLIETPNGLLLAVNAYKDTASDRKYNGELYSISVDAKGGITLTKLAKLPNEATFNDYYYNDYYHIDYGIEEDMPAKEGGRRSIAYYPYYGGASSEKFVVMDDALVYYHIGAHTYNEWKYNEEAGRYMPTPQERGTDTIYIFDLSDISSAAELISYELDTYSFMGIVQYEDTIYVQHRMSGVDVWNDSGYYYYSWYYKNYVAQLDLSDLSSINIQGEYNIPGNLLGAGEDVLFSQSEWSGSDNNVTINTLTIENGTAKITSAVKISESHVDVLWYDNKAYIISRPNYYYYYDTYGGPEDDSVDPESTTFKVIDFSSPGDPSLELTAEIEGYLYLRQVTDNNLIFYNSYESSIIVYSTNSYPDIEFEAMAFVRGGYENIRAYEDAVYIPQGYYGVIEIVL